MEIYIISRQMTSFLIHSYGEHKLWSAPLGGTISILQPLGRGKGGRKEEKTKENKRALRMDGVTLAMGQCCACLPAIP